MKCEINIPGSTVRFAAAALLAAAAAVGCARTDSARPRRPADAAPQIDPTSVRAMEQERRNRIVAATLDFPSARTLLEDARIRLSGERGRLHLRSERAPSTRFGGEAATDQTVHALIAEIRIQDRNGAVRASGTFVLGPAVTDEDGRVTAPIPRGNFTVGISPFESFELSVYQGPGELRSFLAGTPGGEAELNLVLAPAPEALATLDEGYLLGSPTVIRLPAWYHADGTIECTFGPAPFEELFSDPAE